MRTITNAEKPDINVVRSLVQEIDRVASKIESELRKAESRVKQSSSKDCVKLVSDA
jgi:hypothetical protein